MNMVFLNKDALEVLEREGRLQRTLRDMPAPVIMSDLHPEPIVPIRIKGKKAEGVCFTQADMGDY
jgi:hypothetical protein